MRCIGLCKKALLRGKGPEKRAAELKVEEIEEERWTWRPKDKSLHSRPAISFAWACAWMLREVELNNMQWGHITELQDAKTVRLTLPTSKTDQRGIGTRRTLTCCGMAKCTRSCPWMLWKMLKAHKERDSKDGDWMFVDQKGKHLTKAKTVQGWKELSNVLVSGHSARRSGAMAYVRAGLPIQELAFLGRWKSSVVLRYAEDALQDVPANDKCKFMQPPKTSKPIRSSHTEDKPRGPEETVKRSEVTLWVASNNYRKNKTWHYVKLAGWQMPLDEWSTSCGWNFANCSANVSFLTGNLFNLPKCAKCKEWLSTRDEVKEGKPMACAISNSLEHVLLDGCSK